MSGTSVFSGTIKSNLYIQGGTAVLTGPTGTINGTQVNLAGGTFVLDNTLTNITSHFIPRIVGFGGGNLILLGNNGSLTHQYLNFPRGTGQRTGPVFDRNLNVIRVQAPPPSQMVIWSPPASSRPTIILATLFSLRILI
jgi:hypothetical protein